MTDVLCGYDDRDEALVAFLYEDPDGSAADRARFETHLQTCARCQADVAALRGVRAQLARWAPPEPSFAVVSRESSAAGRKSGELYPGNPQSGNPQSRNPQSRNPQSAIRNPQSTGWRAIPAWAQVAAALLFLGVSAGVANLDVRYDQNGLTIRTGWLSRPRDARVGDAAKPGTVVAQPPSQGLGEPRRSSPDLLASGGGAPAAAASKAPAAGAAQAPLTPAQTPPTGVAQRSSPADQTAPWHADLAALERQLKAEFRAAQASSAAVPGAGVRTVSATAMSTATPADADVTRRVRAIVEESEKRQQRELALRIAELLRDVNAQRQADLVKIDRTLGVVQNSVGIEVMKNRQQIDQMNLLYRASQKQ